MPPTSTPRKKGLWAVRLAVLLAFCGLIGGAWYAFDLAGHDYWEFWLKSGPVIGLATGAFGWAWGGLDRNPGLVSVDPLAYAGSALQVAGLPLYAFGGHLREDSRGRSVSTADIFAMLPLSVIFVVGIVCWLLLIAPAQYFAFLIAGAPARIALQSRYKVYAHLERDHLQIDQGPALSEADYPKEKGWWDASMRDRPVTIASAFMAAGILIIDIILG